MLDRIHQLLDKNPDKSAVLAVGIDWHNAFDRIDPTLCVTKFIRLGLRNSLIPILIDYLSDRQMSVKYNGVVSSIHKLIGGGPQGTQLGQVSYSVANSDAGNRDNLINDAPPFTIDKDDRYKYCDDMTILELICLAGILKDYDCWNQVPSDIRLDQKYLPPECLTTQVSLNQIAEWTNQNLMLLNPLKSNYMMFRCSKSDFATRLAMDGKLLDRKTEVKLCGVWLTESLTWDKHISELSRNAYSRMQLLSKLKYVGVSTDDLIEVYCLYIRSLLEYCAVVFHSSLTEEQCNTLKYRPRPSV